MTARTTWRKWITNPDVRLLWAVAVAVLGMGLFFVFASEVREGEMRAIDEAILRAFRDPANLGVGIGPAWFPEAMRDITALGSFAVLFLLTACAVVFLLLARRFRAVTELLAAVLLGQFANHLLKHAYARQRPTVVPHLAQVTTESFPSGHAMMSAIVYLSLASLLAARTRERKFKLLIMGVAVFLTFLVGVSRVYLGVHYPSDVLAGWAAGVVWALAASLAAHQPPGS